MSSYSKSLPFNLQEWLASKYSLQNHPWIKHEGHENKGIDHQPKKFLIVKQILHVSSLGNVYRTIWKVQRKWRNNFHSIPDGDN